MGRENSVRKGASKEAPKEMLWRLLRWLRLAAPPRLVPMIEPDPSALKAWRALLSRKGPASHKGQVSRKDLG